MTDNGMGESWDLSEVLRERVQPKTEVTVYLSEVASYTKAELLKAKPSDPVEAEAWDKALAEVEAILDESKYVIHVEGIPSRMREDLASKGLHKYPIKPTGIFNQDDPENQNLRTKYTNDLIWLAQIRNVVNPKGQSKSDWTLEEIQAFSAALPSAAQQAIDKALRELTLASEEFTVASKSPDFSWKP